MQSMVRSTLSRSTYGEFPRLLAGLHRGSDPLSSLLNITTTCNVTRGAAVEISEDFLYFSFRSRRARFSAAVRLHFGFGSSGVPGGCSRRFIVSHLTSVTCVR